MSFLKSIKDNYMLIWILLFGTILRLVYLDKVPVSIFGDEMDVGIHANSILVTGRDYLGNFLPTYFHSFAEFRLPMQLYVAVPFIKLFGLTEWGVRLGSVLFGILSLWGMFLLARELFSKRVGLIATLFLAISPWHLHFSRQANDSGFMLPFLLFGTWFFVKGLKDYKYLVISAALFAISFYSYATAALFTPIYIVILLLLFRRQIFKYSFKQLSMLVVLVLLLLAPYINVTRKNMATARFSYISVASESEIALEVTKKRAWSDSSLTKLFYNRNSIIASEILKNYLNTFSTNLLFVNGDPILRHSVGGMGELYYFDLILILIGLFALTGVYRKGSSKTRLAVAILAAWLLVAPLPSALTDGRGYHAARQLPMLPVFIVISALGFDYFLRNSSSIKKKLILLSFVFIMVLNFTYYLHKYYAVWPKDSWRFWNSGYKEAMTFVRENDASYEKVLINNTYEPALPRFLFWYRYDPKLFLQEFEDDKHIEGILPGFDGFKLGEKYYFGKFEKPMEDHVNAQTLIVASARDDVTDTTIFGNPEINLLKTVYSPTGTTLFYVFTASK